MQKQDQATSYLYIETFIRIRNNAFNTEQSIMQINIMNIKIEISLKGYKITKCLFYEHTKSTQKNRQVIKQF